MDAKDIRARYKAAQSDRSALDSVWTDVVQYVLPYRDSFYRSTVEENSIVYDSNAFRYDDTAVYAAQTLAASVHGSLTSFTAKWFEFTFQDKALREDKEARDWLEEVSDITYTEMVASNFSLEVSEMYIDIVGFGTGPLTVEQIGDAEDNYDGLDFRSIPVVDSYFDEDHSGNVLNFYRRLNWSALKIVNKLGTENIPDKILNLAKTDQAGITKFEVIFCIFKRDISELKDAANLDALTPENRPYGFMYVDVATGEEMGEGGGYYEMPAFVARWRKTNDSKWGNSPAMKAMATIKSANEIVRMTLTQLGKVINPPTLATERGLLSDLDIEEGGLTVVRSLDDVKEYESKARFDVGEVKLTQLQESIRQGFFIDQLALKDSPAMTATEVQVRWQLMQRLLGPTMGRLESQVFSPLLKRVFNILARAGKFPQPPQQVQNADYDVEYIGPLPKAQRAQEVVAIEGFLADITSAADLDPEVLDTIDFDKVSQRLAEMRGVPSDIMAGEAEIARKRRQRQEAAEAAAQAEQAETLSKADKNTAQADQARTIQ
jgi:hypothetical protein